MGRAKCAICNRDYKICNSCNSQKVFKPWRSIVDSIEHYKIYLAIHGYTISKNKESAKAELAKCDLTDLKNFKPEIKSVIEEIMQEPIKVELDNSKNIVKRKEKGKSVEGAINE